MKTRKSRGSSTKDDDEQQDQIPARQARRPTRQQQQRSDDDNISGTNQSRIKSNHPLNERTITRTSVFKDIQAKNAGKKRKSSSEKKSPPSSQRRTSRRRTRSSDRARPRRFHHAKVMIIIDGDLLDVGYISSEPSSSSSSDSTHSEEEHDKVQNESQAGSEVEKLGEEQTEKMEEKVDKPKGSSPALSIENDAVSLKEKDGNKDDDGEEKEDEEVHHEKNEKKEEHLTHEESDGAAKEDTTSEVSSKADDESQESSGKYEHDDNVDKDEELKSVQESKEDIETPASEEDDDVPLKEIDTSKSFEENDDASHAHSRERRRAAKSESRGPKYLDSKTLNRLKSYFDAEMQQHGGKHFGSYRAEELDETEVELYMLRMIRTAIDQARHQTILLSGENKASNLSETFDSDDDEYSFYDECLQDAEEHAVGHDLLKKIISKIQKDYNEQHPYGKKNKCLDKKTMNWLKRSTGLYRSGPSNLILDQKQEHLAGSSSENKQERVSTRRYTRTMARDNRRQKQEKGLDLMCRAINDLEGKYGPFPEKPSIFVLEKTSLAVLNSEVGSTSANADSTGKRERAEDEESTMPTKKTKSSETDSMSLLTKPLTEDSERETSSCALPENKLDDVLQKGDVDEPPEQEICTSLRQLDLMWREREARSKADDQGSSMYSKKREEPETREDYETRKAIDLHPQFTKAGIVHRLPCWDKYISDHEKNALQRSVHLEPPRRRHTNEVYAELCSRLLNCLQGRARLFATCEFFYSDLDKDWYDRNEFMEDAKKLGIPPAAKLTRSEWKAIRRRIQRRPRRFSKKFISSQLSRRNEYRNAVRMIQRNPELSQVIRFPYDVSAPISIGTTVNALNKTYRIIQRGTVLAYDRDTALYLIQFESKQFGYELCPDTDVATSGPPQIVARASRDTLKGNRIDDEAGLPVYGSCIGEPPLTGHLSCRNGSKEIANALNFKHWNSGESEDEIIVKGNAEVSKDAAGEPVGKSLEEEIAEHEAFLTLLDVIESAKCRKLELLSILEDINSLMISQLPPGVVSISHLNLSESARDHLRWLMTNLQRTNHVLDTSIGHLRNLYGAAYLPEQSKQNRARSRLVEKLLKTNESAISPTHFADEYSDLLLKESKDLGGTIASYLFEQFQLMPGPGDQGRFLQSRLSLAGQLLCASSFAQNISSKYHDTQSIKAIKLCSKKLVEVKFPRKVKSTLYKKVLLARDHAIQDLDEAVNLLNTELALSSVKRSAQV